MAINERIAHGEIYVEVNDEQARAALKAIDRDFDRTMRDIDRESATVGIDGNLAPLEDALVKAKRKLKAAEGQKATIRIDGNTSKVDRTIRTLKREIKRLEGKKAIVEMEVKGSEKAQAAIEKTRRLEEKRVKAFEQAEARRQRIMALSRAQEEREERARVAALRRESDFRVRMNKQREAEMASAHSWALRIDKDRAMEERRREQELRDVPRLQRKYADLEQAVARLNRERGKARTLASPALAQQVDLKTAEAVAEMAALRTTLSRMGARPIDQKINLNLNEQGVGMLGRWIAAITETTVRIGPFTTTIAGLGRALLLLGPIISGVVGQFGALTAAVGAGLVGALGVAGGALGAFGLALGGVAFLIPSLLRDFKNLNTLQDAYHKQVLKTGANSDKAKTKLEEFEHAMGEVGPTTLAAFMSIDKLQTKWRDLSKAARPDFLDAIGASIQTVNAHFDWFGAETLTTFGMLSDRWQHFMRTLRGPEATRGLHTLTDMGQRALPPLLNGLGSLGAVLGRVMVVFSRHLPSLLRGFDEWAERLDKSSQNASKLESGADKLVESLRSVGHFAQAAGRFLVALFAPGIDPGASALDRYADGLNRTAEAMRTTKRAGIQEFFQRSISTAEKFWRAVSPLAQLFFEWSTIMQPFTDVALRMADAFGDLAEAVLSFGPAKALMQGAFAIFLTAAVLRRVAAIGTGLWSIVKALGAMRAAGGLSGALKGGGLGGLLGKGAGVRGQTPATPMYVMDVRPGMPGGGGPALPGGGLGNLGRLARVGGGIAIAATAMIALHKGLDKLAQNKATAKVTADIQRMVATRNIEGLRALQREFDAFPDGLEKARGPLRDAIKGVEDLENTIARSSIRSNFANIARDGAGSMNQIRNVVKMNTQTIKDRLGKDTAEGRRALAYNFRLAAQAVRDRMRESGKHTKEGAALLRRYMIDALKSMGLSGAQAEAKIRTGTIQTRRGPQAGAATGGLFQIGSKGAVGPDNVPMNLGGTAVTAARGEQIAVFNRHQQAAMGAMYPGGLEAFFGDHRRPHYMAGGGIVPVPGFPGEMAAASILDEIAMVTRRFGLTLTDAFGSGHESPGHTIYGTAADFAGADANMDAAVKALVAAGYLVGYDGRFGSQAWPGHGPSYVAGGNAHLHVEFGAGGRGGLSVNIKAPDIKQVYSELGGGPGAMTNQALGIVHKVAQQTADRIAKDMLFMPVAGGGDKRKRDKQIKRTQRPNALGGLVDRKTAAQGGVVDSPRLLVGEEPRYGETVISHNPRFRSANVEYLKAAAAALGIPMARKGKPSRKPKFVRGAGRDVDSLRPVDHYRDLQQKEQDKNRTISIEESKIKEPDTFIKVVGQDANGEDIYEVDTGVVQSYQKAMEKVRNLYNDLVGPGGIMDQMRNTAERAYDRIREYIEDRQKNISSLRATIDLNRGLLKSKDKDVREHAQKRIDSAREMVEGQQRKIEEGRTVREDIRTDQHDANFRRQEYEVSRNSYNEDIAAVGGKAAADAAAANPEPEAPGIVEPGIRPSEARLGALEAEAALAEIGVGINGQPPREMSAIMADQLAAQNMAIAEGQAMLTDTDPTNDQEAYGIITAAAGAIKTLNEALGQLPGGAQFAAEQAKSFSTARDELFKSFSNNFSLAGQIGQNVGGQVAAPFTGAFGAGPFAAMPGVAGGTVINLTNNFKTMPQDPHIMSKNLAWEVQAVLG